MSLPTATLVSPQELALARTTIAIVQGEVPLPADWKLRARMHAEVVVRLAASCQPSASDTVKPVWPADAPKDDVYRTGYVGGWRDCNNWWLGHTHQSASSAVMPPVGYKLVPAAMTQEMVEAAKDERMHCFSNPTLSVEGALRRIYGAMIAASPNQGLGPVVHPPGVKDDG